MPRIYSRPLLRVLVMVALFMSAAVSALAQGGSATVSFVTTPDYPAGVGIFDIALADFNGDGNMDAATTNGESGDLTILIGRGSEGFAPPVRYLLGLSPYTVKAGDFNKDGRADLITLNRPTKSISVLLGDGTGSFSVSTSLTLPTDTLYMVLGDFNGDGNLDGVAAVTGSTSNKLTFLKGNGAGGFTATVTPLVYDKVLYGLAAGDFNEDGKLDVVGANAFDGVIVLQGDGAGGFSAPVSFPAGNAPYNVAVADFNGDNHLDLVVSFFSDLFLKENVVVMLGTGTGSFGAPKGFVANKSPWQISTGDFNGDNKQDMAVVGSGGVSVFLGDGTGSFGAARSYASGAFPRPCATGDFNNDGKLDIVVGNSQVISDLSNGLALMLGDGTGDFVATRQKQVAASPGPMAINDFNNDGKLDVAVLSINNINGVNYSASILLGDGAGNSTESQRITFSFNQAINSVATGDFNKDGKADLAITVGVSGIAILLGDGTGHFPTSGPGGTPVITSLSSYINGSAFVRAADFNNDGNLDLVVSGRYSGGFVTMLGDGAGNFTFIPGNYFSNAGDMAVGDFNKDGKADFALVSDKIYILLGDGAGHFNNAMSLSVADFVYGLTIGDFNKDGKTDIAVARNSTQKNLTIFLASAGSNFGFDAAKDYDAPVASPRAVTTADFNNDGNADLATANGSSYNVTVFAGDGAGNFLPGIPFDLGVDLGSIAAGDFNGDQKIDLLMASGWTNSVHLILNNYTTPKPTLSVDDISLVEGNTGTTDAVFTVRLSDASSSVVKVNYVFDIFTSGTSPSYAKSGEDFQGANGTLTFQPGVTIQTIMVPVSSDTLDEFDEIFKVNLTNPVNAVLYKGTGVATIKDNDDPPTISISDAGPVSEGNTDKTVTMTVSLSQPSGKEITVDVTAADGTTSGALDVFGSTTSLTFPAGTTSRSLSLTIRGDNIYETDETFFENLSNAVNATIADAQGQLTIVNDDPLPSVVISDISVTEGATGTRNATFSVGLSNPSYQQVTVNYTTADGTATAGLDYTATSGAVTFNPGETFSKSFSVPVIGDTLDEIDEVFYLNLSVTNGTAPTGQVKATIFDDDGPAISINDISVYEGNSDTTSATFTVTLSAPSPQDISVRFSTQGGTATSNVDYQFSFNQQLMIPAGSASGTITIPVKGDTTVEPDETFSVALTNPIRATIADAQGVCTILNDDSSIQFSASAYSINEGTVNTPQGFGSLIVDVKRTGNTSADATVQYFTSDDSGGNECNQVTTLASQRCDYSAAAGTLRFAAGETTKQIQIPIINDGYIEGAETFKLKLQNPTGTASLGTINEATVTIDDRGALTTPAENPYLSNEFFVRLNYLDFLGREPDTEGWNTWPTVLNNCGSQQGFLGAPFDCDRAHVSHGFFASPEFTNRGFLIYRLYAAGMN
ncbi:MAG: VCBS repeat-containing protein, partial [Pyrinomonadaceae bacterium]|nr:VCBS repeat-containing protein [Pyrinomonadaceae bacterium]